MNQDTMTVKELAEVAAVSTKTVRRAVKSIGYDLRAGVTSRFQHDQCIRIIGAITSVKRRGQMSTAPRTDVQTHGLRQTVAEVGQNVQPEIIKTFNEALQTMNALAAACLESNAMTRKLIERMETPAQPALSAPDYMTVSGFCHEKRIVCDGESAKRWGRMARELSDVRGHEVRTVPDQRWGKVNAYRTSVLAEVVGQ